MLSEMRTTVTLDDDTEALIRRRMRERKVSFKQALNDAIRAGCEPAPREAAPFQLRTFAMGIPAVNLDKALQIAGDLEDQDLIRKMRAGS